MNNRFPAVIPCPAKRPAGERPRRWNARADGGNPEPKGRLDARLRGHDMQNHIFNLGLVLNEGVQGKQEVLKRMAKNSLFFYGLFVYDVR